MWKVETLSIALEDTEEMMDTQVRRESKQMVSTPMRSDTHPQHV